MRQRRRSLSYTNLNEFRVCVAQASELVSQFEQSVNHNLQRYSYSGNIVMAVERRRPAALPISCKLINQSLGGLIMMCAP
jgi:hypothetical protein